MGLLIAERATPSTPATDLVDIYPDNGGLGKLHVKNDLAMDHVLTEDGLRGSNIIINGGHDLAQRQVPTNATTYSNTSGRSLSADRFGITNENTSVQFQQFDTSGTPESGLNNRNYGRYSKITTTGKIVVSQVIEAGNCLHLRGKTVRVQLLMKASAAKTMRVALLQLTNAGTIDTIPATFVSAFGANGTDPTFGTNLSKITPTTNQADNATISSTGLSCNVTTAWQRFGGVFDLPTDFKNLILVVFTNDQFAAADHFNMSEVGIYQGSEVREWVAATTADQLANCQRYYCKSFPMATAPAQNAGSTNSVQSIAGKAGATALGGNIHIRFPVVMRTTPTVTLYCPTEVSAQVDRLTGTTPIAHTASAQADLGDAGLEVTSTGTANTAVGDVIAVHYSAEAEL